MDKEELKQKATECWDKRWNNKLADIGKWEHQKALPYDNYIDGFSDGYLAGLKEKAQWHDLRENPEDLPTDYRDVFIFYGYGDYDNSYCIGYYSIGNKVWCENPDEDAIKLPVIAWCELPTFKE